MAPSFEEKNLQTLLEKVAQDENFKVPEFEVSYGSKPGDNFVGRIYRAVIKETSKNNNGRTLSLIFKASPSSKLRKEKLSTDEMFQVESEVYQLILPAFNALLKKHGITDSDVFPGTARCYRTEINEADSDTCHVLVLEDKTVEGFGMFCGESKTLDGQHCRVILKRIALWHAASIALNQHDPQTARKFATMLKKPKMFLYDEKHPLWTELAEGAKDTLNKIKGKIDDLLWEKIHNLADNFARETIKLNQPTPDLFCILHGDCWTNNILFKYAQDGTVEDVCLVDLQIGRVGSPVVEIAYFLLMCTSKEVRDQHFNNLVRFYHDQVSSYLERMECNPQEIYPWEMLQDHLRRFARIGVHTALSGLPMMAADTSDINVDLHAAHHEGNVFVGRASVSDHKKQDHIFTRIVDIIQDCNRWGYI